MTIRGETMATAQTTAGNGRRSRERAEVGAPEIERRGHGVAIVWIDTTGDGAPHAGFADEFDAAADELERDGDVRAVVLASRRPAFVAGAEVPVLLACATAADGEWLARKGQKAMNRIAGLDKPVVAAVHGPCLGGGLELALACHARVASDDRRTRFGAPDVKLGVLPAAGGTVRLPQVVGVSHALDLLLSGRKVNVGEAVEMGIVEEAVPFAILLDVAIERALAMGKGPREKPSPAARLKRLLRPEELRELALGENPLGRRLVFEQWRRQLFERTQGNYPAPRHIIDVVRTSIEKGFEEGLEAEAKAFGRLVVTPEAKQLMRLFLATQQIKAEAGVADPSVEAEPISRVGVIGAGHMGAGIAYVTAINARLPVRLKDKDDESVLSGLRHVRASLDECVGRERLTQIEADRRMHQVTATIDYRGFESCNLIIEAVPEDLELKQRVLREVEEVAPDDAIFASNTSALPIAAIAEASRHPETVVGMHYFSPVEKMALLEVVATERTAPWVVATCVQLGKRQGKTPIVVRDGVGFYTTRILAPFVNEALHILLEGVRVDRIDEALVRFGFPMGPLRVLDEVGLDVAMRIGRVTHEAFGERMTPPAGVEKLVDEGRWGRASRRGFYRYEDGKVEADSAVYDLLNVEGNGRRVSFDDIGWRCTLQMINEAARCYAEGVVQSARDADVGAVLGLGFPQFHGGPLRFVDKISAAEVVRRLERYRSRYGVRFRPAPVLVEMARQGARFYGEEARGAPLPGPEAAMPPPSPAHP